MWMMLLARRCCSALRPASLLRSAARSASKSHPVSADGLSNMHRCQLFIRTLAREAPGKDDSNQSAAPAPHRGTYSAGMNILVPCEHEHSDNKTRKRCGRMGIVPPCANCAPQDHGGLQRLVLVRAPGPQLL